MSNTQTQTTMKQKTFAFKRVTRKGKVVYRITLDNQQILDNLEQGKTVMAIDIPANNSGGISITKATNKAGKAWEGIAYYSWAMPPQEEKSNG